MTPTTDSWRTSPWTEHVQGGLRLARPPRRIHPALDIALTTGPQDYGAAAGPTVRERLRQALGASALCIPQQVHGDVIADADIARPPPACDGWRVAGPEIAAAVLGADCPGIVLASPETTTFAIVHSGWRGTAAAIATKALAGLVRATGTPAASFHAVIGVGIGPRHYEVDQPVIDAVSATLDPGSSRAWMHATRPGHATLDLIGVIAQQLVQGGIPWSQLQAHPGCTFADASSHHSHRRDGATAGRHLLVACRTES